MTSANVEQTPNVLESYAAALSRPCCEFPNDNPELSEGVRWLCLNLVGPPEPVWPEAARSTPPPAGSEEGPLKWVPGRVALPHRQQNIPAPPAFVYAELNNPTAAESEPAVSQPAVSEPTTSEPTVSPVSESPVPSRVPVVLIAVGASTAARTSRRLLRRPQALAVLPGFEELRRSFVERQSGTEGQTPRRRRRRSA
jgi:hypothetical protein